MAKAKFKIKKMNQLEKEFLRDAIKNFIFKIVRLTILGSIILITLITLS